MLFLTASPHLEADAPLGAGAHAAEARAGAAGADGVAAQGGGGAAASLEALETSCVELLLPRRSIKALLRLR